MALDWDDIPTDNLPKARHVARLLYNKIGKTWSPFFGEYILFSSKGFKHLIYKPSRNVTEMAERLCLLRYAESIISDSKGGVVMRTSRHGEKEIRYWMLRKSINGWLVKLIIMQQGNGQKHFYSIMGNKL